MKTIGTNTASKSAAPAKRELTPAQKLMERAEFETVFGEIPENPQKNSTIIVFGDGNYLLRKNIIGRFIKKTSDHYLPHVKEGPPASFTMSLPRIPKSILKQQVSFYREVMRKHNNAEAYTLILWDREKEEYLVVCPKQKISGANVQYDLGNDYPSDKYIQVVSCHSHNTMGAFFSSTDDADEKGDMLYMVMGRLDQPTPQYSLRACLAGRELMKLPVTQIFDISLDDWNSEATSWTGANDFPSDWMGKLNVVGNYVRIHEVQGGSASGRYTFQETRGTPGNHYGEYVAGKYTQLSLGFEEEDTKADKRAVLACVNELSYDLRRFTIQEALQSFFEGLIENGYAEELLEALQSQDVAEALLAFDIDMPDTIDWSDDFDKVNSFVERLSRED